MKYKVVLHESEEGVAVACPALPGCWSQGANEEEAIANIASAIQEYLDAIEDQMAGEITREIEVPA